MEPSHFLRLCTFEVATHLGRHRRLGSPRDGRLIDLNFAAAWYMAQTGEPEPQRMADALVPANLLDFLRAGLRATHTAEELFLGAGPHPPDWWRHDSPPRGPNDETLVYQNGDVRPTGLFGSANEIQGLAACQWEIASVSGAGGALAGYTLRLGCGARTVLGPCLVRPFELPEPTAVAWVLRVNGETRGEGSANATFPAAAGGEPGELTGGGVLGSTELQSGDDISFEAPQIGVLHARVL